MAATTGHLEKLFVTNLSGLTQPDDLRKLFSAYGNVLECTVNKKEGDKGFAFVKLESHTIAAKAKEGLEGTSLHGRPLKVKWAIPQSVVTVYDLEPIITNDMLLEAFSVFGTVESAVVATDPLTKRSKGYAFISFSTRGSSKKAIQQCTEGAYLVGPTWRPVRVEASQFDEQEEGVKETIYSFAESKPHFAQQGTAEYEFSMKWKELSKTQKREEKEYKDKHSEQVLNMKQMQETAMQAESRRVEALQAALAHAVQPHGNFYPNFYNSPSPAPSPISLFPSSNPLNNFAPVPNTFPPPSSYPPPPANGYPQPNPFPNQGHHGPIRRREIPFNTPPPHSHPHSHSSNNFNPPNNFNNPNNFYPPSSHSNNYPPPSRSHSHLSSIAHPPHVSHPQSFPSPPPRVVSPPQFPPRLVSPSLSHNSPVYPPRPPGPGFSRGGGVMGVRSAPYAKHR